MPLLARKIRRGFVGQQGRGQRDRVRQWERFCSLVSGTGHNANSLPVHQGRSSGVRIYSLLDGNTRHI